MAKDYHELFTNLAVASNDVRDVAVSRAKSEAIVTGIVTIITSAVSHGFPITVGGHTFMDAYPVIGSDGAYELGIAVEDDSGYILSGVTTASELMRNAGLFNINDNGSQDGWLDVRGDTSGKQRDAILQALELLRK